MQDIIMKLRRKHASLMREYPKFKPEENNYIHINYKTKDDTLISEIIYYKDENSLYHQSSLAKIINWRY